MQSLWINPLMPVVMFLIGYLFAKATTKKPPTCSGCWVRRQIDASDLDK